ncbi:MAG TPA: FAD-dependent oxidoreductase [Opitutaceae bacterium]|nr:FAD-dependent oxidoreductase [Opitutaceae bacterium]
MTRSSILVLGGGCFGLTAALELRARGWEVTLVDQGRIPHPDAASTDISKVVRMDYGADEQHTAMGEAAIAVWRERNSKWGETLFHEDGLLVISRALLRPGTFEGDSFALLSARGHTLQRISRETLREKHPVWDARRFNDGYLNPKAGWVESGRVIVRLAIEARAAGVKVVESVAAPRPLFDGARCVGIESGDGVRWLADQVLVAAGAWTPVLLPHLRDMMWATAQSVFHFKPREPQPFTPPEFPVWFAEIGSSGWYGFPANADGIVKVADHGPGRRVSANDARAMPEGEEARYRAFLSETFPSLADAPVVATRVCLYCDTFDYAFWIDHDPQHSGLIVAAGDSGHGLKFTPILGGIIADVVERKPNPWVGRYRWRERPGGFAAGARS